MRASCWAGGGLRAERRSARTSARGCSLSVLEEPDAPPSTMRGGRQMNQSRLGFSLDERLSLNQSSARGRREEEEEERAVVSFCLPASGRRARGGGRTLVRAVVDDEVEKHLHAASVHGLDELEAVVHGAERLVDVVVVGDVVALVDARRLVVCRSSSMVSFEIGGEARASGREGRAGGGTRRRRRSAHEGTARSHRRRAT